VEEIPMPKLFRVILPVSDIEQAARFYSALLAMPGERVSPGRHYFDCDGTILACFDPRADGDNFDSSPNPNYVYFTVSDLDATFQRAKSSGCSKIDDRIEAMPWGERMFYAKDPFGNPISFVDEKTVFTGHAKKPS
jgi:predicted enzyme related to lactoylglutathione lyase